MIPKQEITGIKPKHMQVSDIIRGQILSGELAKGSLLLPDGELACKYKINRHKGLWILALKQGMFYE